MIRTLIIATLLLATAASAYTIALPGLAGGYEGDPMVEPNFDHPWMRSQVFTMPDEVTAIDQLEVVLAGEWADGELGCYGATGWEIVPWGAPMTMILRGPGSSYSEYMYAIIAMPEGPFDEVRASFQMAGGMTYADLLGVEVSVELFIETAIVGTCAIETDVHGTLSDVLLDIQGTVPADGASWSSVKSLFR